MRIRYFARTCVTKSCTKVEPSLKSETTSRKIREGQFFLWHFPSQAFNPTVMGLETMGPPPAPGDGCGVGPGGGVGAPSGVPAVGLDPKGGSFSRDVPGNAKNPGRTGEIQGCLWCLAKFSLGIPLKLTTGWGSTFRHPSALKGGYRREVYHLVVCCVGRMRAVSGRRA